MRADTMHIENILAMWPWVEAAPAGPKVLLMAVAVIGLCGVLFAKN